MGLTVTHPLHPLRVLLLGATGTIGRATLCALQAQGHEVVCLVRPGPAPDLIGERLTEVRAADVTQADSVWTQGFRQERFDAVVSCLASRTGLPEDAWLIDHRSHLNVLQAALQSQVRHFVLLSAICVQKPKLAFQEAKLAFERALMDSGLTYSIVRPTAYFKSLSGQIERVRKGQAFWVLGDGRLTACKPISDADLADYLVGCLSDPQRHHRVLPIGGPGPAISPIDQAQALSHLLGRPVRVKHMPVTVLRTLATALGLLGRVSPALRAKAQLARIGLYYATESMLVWDPHSQRYDADATPEHGHETLFDFYSAVLKKNEKIELRDHAVF
jgi:divinyl chlorophyllide a 8-vinyl-reductase